MSMDRHNALADVYLARLYVTQEKMQEAIEKYEEAIWIVRARSWQPG